MSYRLAEGLQTAVYQCLTTDAALTALVGAAIYDAIPAGAVPEIYVAIGDEEVRDRSDITGAGAEHRFVVSVVTETESFIRAKSVAAAVSAALTGAELMLTSGRVVGLWFDRAVARRVGRADRVRRIDLRFRARVED